MFKTHHFPKWNKYNQIPAKIWGGRDLTRISTRIKCRHSQIAEVGTNNVISKAQRSFQPVKAQRKMRNLIFLLTEAQRNFRNELFDSVEAQRNSAIAERYFRTKVKRNLTSAIEISQHNANTAFFTILD